MPKDPNEPFDDLFQPFGLDDGPPPEDEAPRRTTRETTPVQPGEPVDPPSNGTAVYCAACGNPNDPSNRHCELCGARLARSQTPVAPQPMLRTTAGARALVVLSSIVLAVAVLALLMNLFGGGGEDTAASSTSTSTTIATVPIGELTPIRVDCTSELSAFPCQALIDDDPTNRWNATADNIVGAELTFFFSPPVQITEIFFTNVSDDEGFARNARIRGIEIEIDDLAQTTIEELDDTNEEPQRIQIRSLRTSSVTMTISSAYPGTSFEGNEPFQELALQEIQFFGRVAPEPSG